MKAQWKIVGNFDVNNQPVVIAKIRTEHEVVLNPSSLATVQHAIGLLRERADLNTADDARVAWELDDIVAIYHELQEAHARVDLVNTEWKDFTGELTFDALKAFSDALTDVHSFRIEGSPEAGVFVNMTDGINVTRVAVDEDKLHQIYDHVEAIRQTPGISANAAAWVGVILGAINLGFQMYKDYRDRQEAERQRQEAERRQKEKEERQHQQDCSRTCDCTTSDGGPAADSLRDFTRGLA